MKEPDPRPYLNIVFNDHVDAGKSTTCNDILYLYNQMDERKVETYPKQAKEKRTARVGSWLISWTPMRRRKRKEK